MQQNPSDMLGGILLSEEFLYIIASSIKAKKIMARQFSYPAYAIPVSDEYQPSPRATVKTD
jgi:hypothetical protein